LDFIKHYRARKLRYILIALILLCLSVGFAPRVIASLDRTPPVIDVWYGMHQTFGQPALAQRWVDILGNVSDPQSSIASLRYRLNNGPFVLTRLGPDDRRLEKRGDFNLEIDPAGLREGDNKVLIEARNNSGVKKQVTVTVTYKPGNASLPYQIDWSKVSDAQQVLQIVDGQWAWDASGIRPVGLGYDRMIAVGDAAWTDYEVSAAVTVHGIDADAYQEKAGGEHAGISIDMRWIGHSDDPRKCDPAPRCGWNPVGDFNKYWFQQSGSDYLGLKILEDEKDFATLPYKVQTGHTYIFKASVQTMPGGNLYRFKVWEPSVQAEPPDWMFERLATPGLGGLTNPDHGGFALVAHETDVTFGSITVSPLP
jgi:hypothetical protein